MNTETTKQPKDSLYAMSAVAKLLMGVVSIGIAIAAVPVMGVGVAVLAGAGTLGAGLASFYVIDKHVEAKTDNGSVIAGGIGSTLRLVAIMAIEALAATMGLLAAPVVAGVIGIVAPLLAIATMIQLVFGALRAVTS